MRARHRTGSSFGLAFNRSAPLWQLSAILGVVSDIIVRGLQPRRGPQKLSPSELMGSARSGMNIVGGSAIKEDYQVYLKASRKQQSRAFHLEPSSDNTLVIEFGDCKANYEHGCLTGYVPFDGTNQLALTTPSTFPAGSYGVLNSWPRPDSTSKTDPSECFPLKRACCGSRR